MAANNPFFGNPLDKVTEERRARRLELPDFSEVRSSLGGSSLDISRMPAGSLLPPPELEPLFVGAAQQYQVPANVLMAIGQQESSYNPGAIGQETKWGRAKGLMQYIDDTARGMGINALDPAQSVDAAAKQFQQRLKQGYSVEEAIMAHHGGDDRSQWGPKTRKYLRDVTQKALAIREQWQPPQPEQPKGMTRDAVKSAEEVAAAANQPPPVEGPALDSPQKVQGDEYSAGQVEKMREQAVDPDEFDALTGADIKAGKTDTPLDLVRRGLNAVNEVLQTPASEFDILTRLPEGPSGEQKPKGGILGDVTGNIAEATRDPAEFTGEYERDHADQIDAFTGAAPKIEDRTWAGWVEALSKEFGSGASSSVAASVEGTGIIMQQMANVEAGRQVETRAKALDGARTSLQRVLEANKDQDPQVTMLRAQGIAEDLAQREIDYHKSVVEWAEKEPDQVASWLRGLGVDIGKLAETLQADPEYKGITTDIASGMGSMLTYMGPGFLTTLLTRGSSAAVRAVSGIAGASALAGPAGAADAYQRAIEYGLSEEDALHIAMKGIPAGIIQVAPVAVILQRIPVGLRGKAVAQFRHLLESFGSEFIAEGSGAVLQNLVEKSYNKEKGVWDDSLYQAAIGGSSAALIALGVQLATRGRGIGPIDAGDLGRALDENIRKGEWNTTPEMEALRIMDPQAYMATIRDHVEAASPEAILGGDLSQPEGPAPAGPIERAAAETAREQAVEQVPGERVTVQTITGKIGGTVEDYFEDGEGGFQVQILSDEGEQYVFDQNSQVVITRDEILNEALGETATTEEAPKAGEKTEEKSSPAEEAPSEATPSEKVPSEQERAAERHANRAQQRIGFLTIAESQQDVEDLIAAEMADPDLPPGETSEARNAFLQEAGRRAKELGGEITESQAKTETKVEAPSKKPSEGQAEAAIAASSAVGNHLGINRAKRSLEDAREIAFKAKRDAYSKTAREDQIEDVEKALTGSNLEQPFPTITVDERPRFGTSGGYDARGNTVHLSANPTEWARKGDESPAAVTPARTVYHEVGHWGFMNLLNGKDRLAATRAVKGDMRKDLVPGDEGHDYPRGKFDDVDEYVAEMYSNHKRGLPTDERLKPYFDKIDGKLDASIREAIDTAINEADKVRREPKETTDATEKGQQQEGDLGEHQDREGGGETAETGGSDSSGQGQAEQGQEEVAQQYQTAVEAEIKREKARMMRLRKGASTPAGRKKLSDSEKRLRGLRQIVFSEPPEGWAPGAPVLAEAAPDTSRTPPTSRSASGEPGSLEGAVDRPVRDTDSLGDTGDAVSGVPEVDGGVEAPSEVALTQSEPSSDETLPDRLPGDAELVGGGLEGGAGTVESESGVNVPGDRSLRRPARDVSSVKSRLDISPIRADFLRDLFEREPGLVEGYRSLDVPRQRVVLGLVSSGLNDRQVFDAIVPLIPVDVMNVLVGPELASDMTFDDVAVLSDALSSIDPDSDVAARFISSVVAGFTPLRAEVPDARIGSTGEGGAAGGAGKRAIQEIGSSNKIFTQDVADRARERLRRKLGQLNTGFDPEMMQDGITLAGYYIEANIRKFSEFAKIMVDDLGVAAKPYLKSWYLGARYDPRLADFAGDMDSAADVDAADIDAILGEATAVPEVEKVGPVDYLRAIGTSAKKQGVTAKQALENARDRLEVLDHAIRTNGIDRMTGSTMNEIADALGLPKSGKVADRREHLRQWRSVNTDERIEEVAQVAAAYRRGELEAKDAYEQGLITQYPQAFPAKVRALARDTGGTGKPDWQKTFDEYLDARFGDLSAEQRAEKRDTALAVLGSDERGPHERAIESAQEAGLEVPATVLESMETARKEEAEAPAAPSKDEERRDRQARVKSVAHAAVNADLVGATGDERALLEDVRETIIDPTADRAWSQERRGAAQKERGKYISEAFDVVKGVEAGETTAPAEAPAETEGELVGAQVTPEQFTELMAEAESFDDPRSPFVTPPAITRAAEDTQQAGTMSLEDAQDRVERWKAAAKAQGESGVNSGRVVLSLFEVSGNLSQPWVDAGYDVQTFDIQTGQDISEFDVETLMNEVEGGLENVHAILACPPCTDFAASGARWWADKDEAGKTEASVELVRQTLRTIELVRPPVWMIENPVGRMARMADMPHPTLTFHPHHYGDPFTKKTLLWGDFNPNLPQANVDPSEGSRTHKLSGRDKDARSETPEGFAYAFFMANNAEMMRPLDLLARQFRGIDRELIQRALDAGLTPEDIKRTLEDDYNDANIGAAESRLRDTIKMRSPEYQAERQRLKERQEELRDAAAAEETTPREQAWADLQFEYVEQELTDKEIEAREENPVPEMPDNIDERAWRFAGIVQSGGYSQREIAVLAATIHKGSGPVTTEDVRNAAALARGENPFGPGVDLDEPFRKAGIMSPDRVRKLNKAFETPESTDVAPPEPAPEPEVVDTTRPTDEVLRPEGKSPRWRTENAAIKYRDKSDLLGLYETEAEGKGWILRRLPTFTLRISDHRYHSDAMGSDVHRTVLLRPEGMSLDLFKALVAAKLREKPSQIIKDGSMVKTTEEQIQRLVDHLEAPVIDTRDPETAARYPIRGGSRDDAQGDSAEGTQPLVDATPESSIPPDPGADPERVDGIRPSRDAGDGEPDADRSRREDSLERGEVAGTPGTADTGGGTTGAGNRPPGSDPLNRTEDRTNTLFGENPGNFVIPEGFGLGQGSDGVKIQANLDAIEIMLRANRENRFATPEEQAILARYVGWGGLDEVFKPKHRGKNNQYGRAYAWLKENLTEEQFSDAKRSIQDAHYTSEKVVGMMWKAARYFGFKGGRVLEPTVGSGNFLGLQPTDLAGASEWHAAELDEVSGQIAQLLYPNANILAGTGFQKAHFADGVMDLSIGNPPFGSQRISDSSKNRKHLDGMKIHNYIIAKAGMHLRPGGVMQMVVTHRFLDTVDPEARSELSKSFRLLGAVRLPNDAFAENAGTSVTTDIVFLQKLREGESPDTSAAWLDTSGEIEVDGVKMRVNRYYQENPQNILGKSSMSGKMYRGQGQEYTVESDGRDIEADFDKILTEGSLSGMADIMDQTAMDLDGQAVMLERSNLAVGGMALTPEGTVILRDLDDADGNAVIREITPETFWKDQAAQWEQAIEAARAIKEAIESGEGLSPQHVMDMEEASSVATKATGAKKPDPTKAEQAIYDLMEYVAAPTGPWRFDEGLAAMEATLERKRLGRKGYDTLRKLLDLRNRTHDLLHAERTNSPDIEKLRKGLDQAYDQFVKSYGLISDPGNLSLLSGDVGVEVGLEVDYEPAIKPKEAEEMGVEPTKAKAEKADILQRRVVWPEKIIEHADNSLDGMSISLSERGRLDTDYIAGLVKKPKEEVIRELLEEGAIFYDPDFLDYVTAEEYLSGNVKHKLHTAMEQGLEDNIAALEKVQPEPKTQEQITPAIRGSWLPTSLFEDFLRSLGLRKPSVLVQQGIGRVSANEAVGEPTDLGLQFSDPDVSMIQLFNAAAAGKSLKVMRRDGETTYEDKAASQRVTAKAERMAQVFKEWAYSDGERAQVVVDAYNRTMNTHRQRTYNGEKYLKTVGQSPSIKLRRTQKDAAWRMIQSNAVLTDHVVGSGKTMTLITGIMERRRLGLSRKPAIVVPNHLVVQWASEFYQLYPGARILAATPDDFAKKNRRRLFARIATGDYDAIIMGHSSFGFIEPPDADVRAVIDENKKKLERAMEEARAAGESGRTLKQMEKKLEAYEERLHKLAERERDEMGVNFKDMGIDYLAVDEAHMFKNLEYATSGERVVGMNDPKGSGRSFDLLTKMRGLQNRGGGVTFATGTPVSNSLVELYTMMRYLANDSLKARDQDHFDAWAGAYAVTETRMEYTATQKLKPRRVLSGLANLDGLGQLYREFADIVTMEDLKRIYAEEKRESNAATGENERTEFPVPKVKHGGRQLDTGDITLQQSEYMDYLVARMQAIEANKSDPLYASTDNPLWVLSDARKMSLDIRVVDPTAERDENGKVMRSARKIKDLYDRWNDDKGTQMVFSDLSTPAKTAGGAAKKLVKEGLEVVFGEAEAKRAQKRIKNMSMREQWKYVQDAAEQVMEDPAITGEKSSKIEDFLAENAFADSTMLVADTGFSVYDDLKLVLSEMGIPAHEIAFIHDYNTPEQKSRLFARVNSGAIRVLIGSTEKMGAGTNAQERLVGLHHLDAPWRPSDVEQREGRIIRQGNKLYQRDPDGFEVEITAYSTNGTSDTVMWQVLERKAAAIEQFRKAGLDSMQEEGADSDQYAEFMAASTGNPVFKLKLEAERDFTNVQAEVGGKLIAVQNARTFMENYPDRKAKLTERVEGLESMEPGDVVFDGETGSLEKHMEVMDAANEKYRKDYDEWQKEYDRVYAEREALRVEGSKKLPALPVSPTPPHYLSDEIVAASDYARLIKSALEKVAAGSKGEGRVVPIKIGSVDMELERRLRPSKEPTYFVNIKLPGGYHSNMGFSEAKNPVDAPNLTNALTPKAIRSEVETSLNMARRSLEELERKLERETALAKEEVSEKPITDAQTLLDWYKDQVKIAEYEADVKRGERKNRYIASDRRRPLDQFKKGTDVQPQQITIGSETFTTTGLAAVEGHYAGSRTTHDATRDSDGAKALVYEVKERQDSEPTYSVVIEPEEARKQRRSATAQSNARKRTRKPAMSVLEAGQRIRQGRTGEVAGKLLDSGKVRIVNVTPGGIPNTTAAYVDEDGIINLVARNLEPQYAEATLLHEAFHAGTRPLIGSRRWDELQERLGKMHRQAERSTGYNRQFWEAARDRIAAAEAAGDVMDDRRRVEEFGAYALEEFASAPASLRKWAAEITGLVKAWLQRMFGIQAGEVTPAQLRALAAAALRNGDMAPSPSFDVGTPELVDGEGNPISEAMRKAEVDKTVRKAMKALTVARQDGIADRDGGLTRDIGRISTYWHQPYSVASMEPQFTPVFRTAVAQHRFRDTIISEMYPRFRAYKELRKEGRDRVNKVLELGRLSGVSYSDSRLRRGVENRGFKRVIVYDQNGIPQRRTEPLHTALSSRGDVIRLTEEERDAYKELRTMFDEALDLFRDQTLIDLGMDQFVGVVDPAAAIMNAITPDMSDRMKDRYENIAKMAEEIEQAKRTGYVPFNRYGRFVITVREKIANVRYTPNPLGGYIASGVPNHMADFMRSIGATWNQLEDGWEVNDAQKRQLGRETTRTVYSEKVDPESFGERWETHKGSKKEIKARQLSFIKERMDAIEAEWGGPGRRVKADDTKKAALEGGLRLSDIDTLADLAQVDNDTWNAIRDDFVKAMRGRGFRKHFFRAENVPGYDLDFERGIADYIGSMAGYLSRRHHEKDWDKAVGAVRGPRLNEYSKEYRKYINDPSEEYALLRQTGFLFYIAGNVSTALLNATQVPIMTMPALKQVMSHAKAAKHVMGAYKDALAMTSLYDQAREGWQRGGIRGSADMMLQMFDPNDAPADVRSELMEAWDDGMFTPQFTHEVMGFSGQRDSSASAVLEKSIDYIASSYTYIERLNRLVTFIAAVRAARDPAVQAKAHEAFRGNALARMTVLDANWSPKNFATFIVDESQFLMGKVNRAKILRSEGAVILQFLSHVLNSIQAWMRWSSLNGRDGKMATAYSIGAIVGLSGVWGAPGLEYLRQAFEQLWGQFVGEDEDLRYNLREWVGEKTGHQWIGEIVDKGALYPLGMDMSGRLGFQRMLPDVSSPVTALGIPADLLLARPWRAGQHALKGEYLKAVGELSPNFVRNPITAREWHDKGVRTRSGNQILTPEQIPTSALWWKAFGIQPSIVSDAYEYRFSKSRAQKGAGVRHRRTIDQIASAIAELDRNTDPARTPELEARLDRLYQGVEEYNLANPDTALDPQSLVRRVQSRVYEYLHGSETDLMRGDPATRERVMRMMEVYNIDDIHSTEEPVMP